MTMNWDDWRYFLALAREGSVSAAGKALNVKHTTVARRITSLESDLGSRLFDRSPSGYALTVAGENLYKHAEQMEQSALAVQRDVVGMDTQLKGLLKLTASYDVMSRLVSPHLGEFARRYPCIDLELLGTTSLVDLSARQADIALRLTAKPPDYLIGREVMPLKHGIYATQAYLEQPRDKHNVILWTKESQFPEWVQQHFPDANVVARTDDVTIMRDLANQNFGLVRIPCYIGDSEPGLLRLDLELKPSAWGIWVLSHVDLRMTPRIKVCREFLVETLLNQKSLIQGLDSTYFNG